jgi:hypothetical protein
VLLATPPEEESYWLERDLLTKARGLTRVFVAQVVVPTTPARVRTVLDAVRQCGQRSGGQQT